MTYKISHKKCSLVLLSHTIFNCFTSKYKKLQHTLLTSAAIDATLTNIQISSVLLKSRITELLIFTMLFIHIFIHMLLTRSLPIHTLFSLAFLKLSQEMSCSH